MYKRILVAMDNSAADDALVPEIGALALALGAELMLVHVADGWVARNFDQLGLAESEEIKQDRAYLEQRRGEFEGMGLKAETHLALGDPPKEILRHVEELRCDLIAMSTHGHRMLADLIFGQTIDKVRHHATVPLFIVSPRRGK